MPRDKDGRLEGYLSCNKLPRSEILLSYIELAFDIVR